MATRAPHGGCPPEAARLKLPACGLPPDRGSVARTAHPAPCSLARSPAARGPRPPTPAADLRRTRRPRGGVPLQPRYLRLMICLSLPALISTSPPRYVPARPRCPRFLRGHLPRHLPAGHLCPARGRRRRTECVAEIAPARGEVPRLGGGWFPVGPLLPAGLFFLPEEGVVVARKEVLFAVGLQDVV